MKSTQTAEDKRISREIHRLFWRANWQAKYAFLTGIGLRIPALIFLHVSIPLSVAYGLQAIINRNFDAVGGYVWQILMFAGLYAVCWGTASVIISKSGISAGKYVQRLVFSSYLKKDYDFYSNTYFGSLGAQALRLREALNNEYNIIVTLLLPKQFIIVGGGIFVIGMHSFMLAAITTGAMLAILSWTFVTSKWRLRYRRELGIASSELSGQIGDALTQATVVKSFAAESYEDTRLEQPLGKWAKAQYTSWALGAPVDMGRMLLTGGVTALLLAVTASLYKSGSIDLALVALVQLYVVKIFAATVDITEMLKTYESAMGAAYQPMKTMLHPTLVNDKPKPLPLKSGVQGVVFDNVSFSYHKNSSSPQAIKDLNLLVAPGEKVGIVGYSGSGKTTLTKLIMRFMDVDNGSIRVGDTDIRDVRQHDLRSKLAYVPQEPLLFHRSIKENIAYGDPEATDEMIMQAAKLAYVDEFADDLPEKYDTLVGERGVKLSGGQRQRVAIARAILKNGSILVLDEATSALDSRSEHLIQKALWELMKDRTAVVVAHRLSTIQRMDKIAVMDKGTIVQYGSHEELLKDSNGIYARLWSHQSGGYLVGSE